MKKYILRLIILLAFTGAFYIKIVNQLVFGIACINVFRISLQEWKGKEEKFCLFIVYIFTSCSGTL